MVEDNVDIKPSREIAEPTIMRYDEVYYLISGSNFVFKLGDLGNGSYAEVLTEEDINALPESILYTGTEENFQGSYFQS